MPHLPPIATVDYHTGGEPFRIITDPPVGIPGDGVADRRVRAMDGSDLDLIRQVLCFEPRGHADMYGGFITPADDDDADFGVLFWHKDGFSTTCGHGTIALGTWAVESGRVAAPDTGTTDVRIDVPSGRVVARVHTEGGDVTAVDFLSLPSYVLATDVDVKTSRGTVRVDIAHSGATFAHVRAADLGLAVEPAQYNDLVALGREVKWFLNGTKYAEHPVDPQLNGVYAAILFDDLGTTDEGDVHQRNVAVFADGQVDRSPCGSGSTSRVAALAARGQLAEGQDLVHSGLVGSRFVCSVTGRTTVAGYDAVIPTIRANAYKCGESVFTIDPRDALVPGFVLR